MRHPLSILALFGLLLPVPAFADVTIRYAPDPPGDLALLVEADGHGRVRAETGAGQMFIMRDGITYVVTPGTDVPTVSRLDDFLVVATEAAHAFRQSHPMRSTPPEIHYRLSEGGPQTVGIWPGARAVVEQIGSHNQEPTIIWVSSSDPALAEAGRVVNLVFDVQYRIAGTILWHQSEILALVRQLRERGTPLLVGGQYRLASVSSDPVPASRFDLPGPVLSQEQLRARQPH